MPLTSSTDQRACSLDPSHRSEGGGHSKSDAVHSQQISQKSAWLRRTRLPPGNLTADSRADWPCIAKRLVLQLL